MIRRDFLLGLAAGTAVLLLPEEVQAAGILSPGNNVSFKCLGSIQGPRYLDGRTANATVGLAPNLSTKFSGTKWRVLNGGAPDVVALRCMGTENGSRFLNGRTQDGSVDLAPHTNRPYTGTRWRVVALDQNHPNIIALKCLGEIKGAQWLDGRTQNSSVGLARTTDPPYTGTHWEVSLYPVLFDDNG